MTEDCIRLDSDVTSRVELSRKYEWLETNGLGGFASGTVAGMNTRRYHGLLVAATQPPVGRVMMLSKVEEALIINGRRYEFSTNDYPGTVHPQGAQYLCEFRLDPFPVFTYQIAGLELEKRVFMVQGENTTVIEYDLRSLDHDPLPDCYLEVRPLLAFRDYHATTHRNGALNAHFTLEDGMVRLQPYAALPALYLGHSSGEVTRTGDWYHDFEYANERDRGLDYREDLFNPLSFHFALNSAPHVAIVASLTPRGTDQVAHWREAEILRRARVAGSVDSDEPLVRRLAAAAGQFIVRRGEGSTIIAGYHWFSDWGRDTMISLPGLTLATGRFEVARNILGTFAESLDRGMLPNRFPDDGEAPEYNTVDATLWFFEAVRAYLDYTGDYAFVREKLYPRLKGVIDWHLRGTRFGIRVDEDGLLQCGEPGVQLTWMDAKIGDWVVTPRTGKPVEIQALWYNALSIMADLAAAFGDRGPETVARDIRAAAKRSFNAKFWNQEAGCLYDALGDPSIRPNQIFAVSLHHSMLDHERARDVVAVVRRELLTPLGLRTLAPQDPRYRPRYQGGVVERDSAYHQGTVWPWLLGPFLTAFIRVHDRCPHARQQAALWLHGLEKHCHEACLGQISEIADGDYPHYPNGCAAQAWSVAELLRCAVEDVFHLRLEKLRGQRISPAA
jgi:predicted glycogen debranching enzyme